MRRQSAKRRAVLQAPLASGRRTPEENGPPDSVKACACPRPLRRERAGRDGCRPPSPGPATSQRTRILPRAACGQLAGGLQDCNFFTRSSPSRTGPDEGVSIAQQGRKRRSRTAGDRSVRIGQEGPTADDSPCATIVHPPPGGPSPIGALRVPFPCVRGALPVRSAVHPRHDDVPF